jgi:hypothetical protein
MPTFNILIATIGRPSLLKQLNSLLPQLQESDCLTVVFDGTKLQELPIFKEFKCTVDLYSEPVALGFWGHAVRNKYAYILKQRDFVLHGDDDDIYTPNALEKLRELCTDTNKLYVAKMLLGDRQIPAGPHIWFKDMATPCGIVPWNENKNSAWIYKIGGDYHFYKGLERRLKTVIFLDVIIYVVRPK